MLEVRDLTVEFRRGLSRARIRALDRVHIDVRPGDFFALLGENGAGKSTAMYCFLGLLRPTSGSVRLLGQSPSPGARLYGDIAYLPEEPSYHLYLTVEEAVRYYAALAGRRIPAARVSEVLERVGLGRFRDLKLSKCSKGMKQKVGIAQCLVHGPKLLFLDEPMRGLDPVAVKEFRDILVELNGAGATIVMNSHMLGEVEAVASRVAILAHGKVVLEDSLAKLLARDSAEYEVELDRADGRAVPSYFVEQSGTAGRLRGVFPADRFHEFMRFAEESRTVVHSCSIRRSSLEDFFVRAVREPKNVS